VVSQLNTIVRAQNFDGVDIDYEYFVNVPAQNFLRDVTLGLRNALPAGSIVTHAPMDPDVLTGKPYYDIIKQTNYALDFLMPQYYNGVTRPAVDGLGGVGSGSVSALSHYQTLVDDVFGGDATKIVFGFCINDCGGTGSNANQNQAAAVMLDLEKHYACNGGAFFWVVEHDVGGNWGGAVDGVLASKRGCSDVDVMEVPRGPMLAFSSVEENSNFVSAEEQDTYVWENIYGY